MSGNIDPSPERASLQSRFTPHGICFGCGPANDRGLRIASVPTSDDADAEVIATWTPEAHHQAFPGVLNGGIIGALLDCHGNWTAAWYLMKSRGLGRTPVTVTMDFHVKLKRPTPVDGPLHLTARVVDVDGDRVTVEATVEAGGKITATMTGRFVAVDETHPAAVGSRGDLRP